MPALRRRLRGLLAIEHEDAADVLHRLCVQMSAHRLQQQLALVAVCVGDVHLDQLVTLEAHFELAQHRCGEPFVSDHHDWVQGMGPRSERPAQGRRKCNIQAMLQKLSTRDGNFSRAPACLSWCWFTTDN